MGANEEDRVLYCAKCDKRYPANAEHKCELSLQFPSLVKWIVTNPHWRPPLSVDYAVVPIEHIKENCLDKQKVKEAWIMFKEQAKPDKHHECFSEEARQKIFEKMVGWEE